MTISHRKRKTGTGSGIQYHCDICKRDITSTVRVRCGKCPDFDLCVECFRTGKQQADHLRTHPYRLLDRYAHPIFDLEWGADEEWLLMEAIDTFGLGNWADIADYVGTKDLDECRAHYIEYYIQSSDYPVPKFTTDFDESEVSSVRKRRMEQANYQKLNILPPMKPKVQPSVPSNHEIQGFMPKREEFDLEHENDAELAVKDMIFNEDDTPGDVELKLAVLEVYNERLDRRAERKKFALERGFAEFKRVQLADRKKSKEEKDVIAKTKCFAPLMTQNDFNSFVKGLVVEQQLRDRIALLQEFRRNGLTSFKEVEEYQNQKRQRINTIYAKSPFVGTSDRLVSKMTKTQQSSRDATPAATPMPSSTTKTPTGKPADIAEAEGYDQLIPAEQELCTNLRLMPRAYLVIKQNLMRDCELRGGLRRSDARKLARIDVNKMTKVLDVLYDRGWLKLPPATPL
jgi:transcriptional adapter 2-alpha